MLTEVIIYGLFVALFVIVLCVCEHNMAKKNVSNKQKLDKEWTGLIYDMDGNLYTRLTGFNIKDKQMHTWYHVPVDSDGTWVTSDAREVDRKTQRWLSETCCRLRDELHVRTRSQAIKTIPNQLRKDLGINE